jgi:hypothetical protein
MRAFEISVNGERVCTAGVPDGTTSVSITHSAVCGDDAMALAIGAATPGSQPLGWFLPSLSLGDELTIRLVEAETADPPDPWPNAEE